MAEEVVGVIVVVLVEAVVLVEVVVVVVLRWRYDKGAVHCAGARGLTSEDPPWRRYDAKKGIRGIFLFREWVLNKTAHDGTHWNIP